MRTLRLVLAVAAPLVVLLCAGPALAVTKTVSLDDQPAETTLKEQYKDSHGVFWRGPDQGDNAFPIVKSVAPGVAHSGNNVADVSYCFACEFWTPRSVGRLTRTASAISAYVGFIGSDIGNPPVEMRLIAYDAGGNRIGSSFATVVQGEAFDKQLTVTSPTANIASFAFEGSDYSGASVGFDDLAITYPDAAQPGDFSLGLGGQNPANVPTGDSVDLPIDVNRVNGSNGDISFSAAGLPAGMSATFIPNPVPGTERSGMLRLTADANAVPSTGEYTEITITGTPGAGAGPAPREVKRSVRISQNCTRVLRADYIDVRSPGCLIKRGNTYEVTGADVRINGLHVKPADDSQPTLVIDPQAKTIKGRSLTMPFLVTVDANPGIPIYAGPIDWDFSKGKGRLARQVIGFELSGIPVLKSLPITEIRASFTQYGDTILNPTVKLGFWPFDYFGSVTSTATVEVDNDNPPDFTGLELGLGNVNALALELKDVKLKWQQGGTWSGSARVVLNFATKYTIAASFGIKNGDFDYLNASVDGLNQPLGAGVFLQRIGFGVTRNPLTLEGSIGLSAGPSVAGAKAVTVDGNVKAVLDDPFVIEVNGKVKLVDSFELAEAYLRYSSTGLFEFGGKVGFDLWLLDLNGQIDGWVSGAGLFNVEGSISACLDVWGPDPCGSARAILSTRGIAGCVGVYGYYVGAGARWSLPPDFDAFTGCDLTPYREIKPSSHIRKAAQLSQTTLPKGLPSAAWEVKGEPGSPPNVTLTGPNGQAVTVSRDAPNVQQGSFFGQARQDGTTFILVTKPTAGVWTVSDDGAVPVAGVREARGLPKPSVTARVSGSGRSRVLSWKLRRIPGQRVSFAELGKDVRHAIGKPTTAASGSVRFRPADGPAGKRQIVALVEQDGQPRTNLTAGSYPAPGPPRPGKPRGLKVNRSGSRLVVSWRPNPGGFRHAVFLQLSDGRQIAQVVGAKARSFTLKGVSSQVGAKIKVLGLTAANRKGPSVSASIKRRIAAPSRTR